ncbi:MAG: 2-amino-4-hydroxy-6-hydroxymethyldihydropteridine diphosphokinase [Proteobacteria bacterium]|nr:2-amino-4-hydroxy-6-hydroxymethyldihydropteridine diphosphokinase [Pseudomonadota bacterium]
MARCYVGLGGNLGDPVRTLHEASAALGDIAGTRLLRASSVWRTAPLGHTQQPDFINAAAELESTLTPRALLTALLALEQRFGRERSFANAPRTLDLDLLLHGDAILDEPGLALPHPRMHERAFVLAPLLELAPDCVIPGRGRAADCLARLSDQPVEKLGA